MKPTDALTPPHPRCEREPKVTPAPPLSASSAQEFFCEALARVARSTEGGKPDALCWLLLMARQLGLEDHEALELATAYPALHTLMVRQVNAMGARADAQRADLQDDLVAAVYYYERHLNATPYDEEARLKLGRIHLSQGKRKEAKLLYEEALKLHEGPCILALKAELLIAYRHFDEAYLIAAEAWEQAPTHAEVLITLSKTQRWMLNHEAERDSLDRALQAHAYHPVALALSLQAEDPSWLPHLRLEDVIQEFTRRPTRHMHLALINALLYAHKYDLALTECRRLLPRAEQDLEVQVALIQTLTYLGQTSEAAERLDALLQVDARHPVALFLKCFLSLLDQDMRGADALEQLKTLSLRSSKVALLYSQALTVCGKQEEAHQVCLHLFRKYPKRSAPLNAYCQSLIELAEHKLVEALCYERLEYFPQDLPVKLSLVEVLLCRGKTAEALPLIEELLPHPKAQEFMVKVAFDRDDRQLVFERSIALLRERPCSPDLIEYAVNATLEMDDLEAQLSTLYELLPIENLYPNQAVLFLQLQLIVGDEVKARQLLESLNHRPVIALSDERLLSVCEAARRLHDPQALKRWVERGLKRNPKDLRLRFLYTVAQWWSAEHELAIEGLLELYRAYPEALPEEELVTLTVWLCELKRGGEARPILDRLYQLPMYLQGVIDSGGVDVIKARVLLYSSSEEERHFAQRALLGWLDQVRQGEAYEGAEPEHTYFEVCERVVSWLIDAELYEVAAEFIEQELAEREPSAELWSLAFQVYQSVSDLELSLYALDQLRSFGALDDRLLLERAELLELLSRNADALQAYHEALKLAPESYEVRLERALALVRAQHLPAAELELLELLEIARKEDEEGIGPELDRGLPSLRQEHFDHPGEALLSTTSQGPTRVGPIREHVLFLWLSQVFEHMSLEEATRLLERLDDAHSCSEYLIGFKGLVKLWGGQTSDSLPLLRVGAARDLYFVLEYARALWESGLRRFSVAVLQECVQKAPQDVEYHKLLIERLIELGDPHSAHSYLLSLSCLDEREAEALSATLYESLTAH